MMEVVMSFLNPRASRLTAGLAVLSAFAVAPVAAQAADTPVTGTLSAGGLSNTAPVITAFGVSLTGLTQTVSTDVGGWSVTDATGTNAGYSVTVSATNPTVGGSTAGAGTGGSLTLTPTTATAAAGNPASDAPVAGSAQLLSTTAATIENAAAGTGQGEWDFASSANTLAVVVPGNASAGSYSSTLTYTTAPPAA
jgi:hypothetical protein